ncbi:MAG: glycoside hydrolase family 6 protein [Actinobacteria bacterium]|nr:glycoside hydrolase family 6 protein [Actinomycetota bacterium]
MLTRVPCGADAGVVRLALAAIAALLLAVAAPAAAQAATVSLTSTAYSVRENAGAATITVVRSSASGHGEVRYGVWYDQSAQPYVDYQPVSGRVDFADGQRTASFQIPIHDDTDVEGDETVKLGIYGAYPMQLAEPTRARLTIVDDDTISSTRDPLNPLGLSPAPTNGDPLQGARFFVDEQWGLANRVADSLKHRDPATAAKLRVIADQPETKRFGSWTANPQHEIATFLQRAHTTDPGAIPLIATYRLKHLQCGHVSDSPAEVAAYKRWYQEFAQGIGNHPVVLFYEIDALITAPCLSHTGLKVRIDELRSAIATLSTLPHAVVYVDAGAGDAHDKSFMARMLRWVGVQRIQGFFTNSTHQDWTSKEIRYARWLVRKLGGTPHYVINTAANGRGPLIPKNRVRYGNSFRCNAPGRGLGPKPTANVPSTYRNLDALIWIGNPGRSAGQRCSRIAGAPPTGSFWVDYALELIRNADFRIT